MRESTLRTKIVAGNWKMHGNKVSIAALIADLKKLFIPIKGVKFVVLPPSTYIDYVHSNVVDIEIELGGQNCHSETGGAYTGEIAASMLRDLGCRFVLVGHSERRQLFCESNEWVAEKYKVAVASGLQPILCVGETLQQREADTTQAVIKAQIEAVLNLPEGVELFKYGVIAYEPIWAIGTGKTATPEQAQQVHAFIRALIAQYDQTIATHLSIIYGGSVKASNATQLFKMSDIDGGLIGGASLQAQEFVEIYQAMGSE